MPKIICRKYKTAARPIWALWGAVAIVFAPGLASGCRAPGGSATPAFSLSAPAGRAPAAGEADYGEANYDVGKWNRYVDLANDLEAIFLPALNAYQEIFGQGPEYRRTEAAAGLVANYFSTLMAEPDELIRVIDLAQEAAAGADGELDRAVLEMSPYLRGLWAGLLRSRDLHLEPPAAAGGAGPTEESFELRGKLEGPEDAHARIFSDYQAFSAIYERFREALGRAGLKRRQRDILALKEEGFIIRSAMLSLLDAGQALQDFLNSRRTGATMAAGLKPEELEPFLAGFEGAARLFETVGAGPGVRERLSAEDMAEFGAGLEAALSAVAALRLAAVEARDKPEILEENLALELGRLVDIYNRLK